MCCHFGKRLAVLFASIEHVAMESTIASVVGVAQDSTLFLCASSNDRALLKPPANSTTFSSKNAT